MTDFPIAYLPTQGLTLSSVANCPAGEGRDIINTNTAALATVVQNQAFYCEVLVYEPVIINNMAWLNGATVAGNVDVGIYDSNLKAVVTKGSTAMSGASTTQAVTLSSISLGTANPLLVPGVYYLAFASNSATATFGRMNLGSVISRAFGTALQTTAFPLPATAVFATNTGIVPHILASQGTL